MTSSEEDMDDLNAFVNEKLQIMSEKCLEQLVGDESGNMEEIFSGNLAAVSGHIVEYEKTVGRSSVLGGHEAPPSNSMRFGVPGVIESVEGGNLLRSGITEASGGVERSDFTSAAFQLWRLLLRNGQTSEMEDCLNCHQAMVWFVCHI